MVATERDSQEDVARRAIVSGHVQGVFFRSCTRQQARALHVRGWVRNRTDGSVEVWAEGEQTAVQALLDWCREGPPRAIVENVLIEGGIPAGLTSFEVR